MTPDVRICDDAADLGRRAADAVTSAIVEAAGARDRCTVALAGGNTPRVLYQLLATRFNHRIPWQRVHVFWGDERFVPAGDSRRNEVMVREALLDHVPCPASNVHPVPAGPDPGAAAAAYELTMRSAFAGAWPRFDLVLLGLGADGHTASLFPGARALDEHTRWAVDTSGPVDPPDRVTLTLPVFNRAAAVHFLVSGADKAPALRRVLDGADPHTCPAAGVRPDDGAVIWWADRAAARVL